MKTNSLTLVFKIVIFAVCALIVCLIAVIAIKTGNEGKAMVNAGTTQIKSITEKYSDIDNASYDNTNIIGSALDDLIKQTISDKEYLSVRVKTKSNATTGADYNYALSTTAGANTISNGTSATFLTAVVTDRSSINYINPNAQFTGKVYRDVNKNIIAVEFTQMD
jgi:hypothetical protein